MGRIGSLDTCDGVDGRGSGNKLEKEPLTESATTLEAERSSATGLVHICDTCDTGSVRRLAELVDDELDVACESDMIVPTGDGTLRKGESTERSAKSPS